MSSTMNPSSSQPVDLKTVAFVHRRSSDRKTFLSSFFRSGEFITKNPLQELLGKTKARNLEKAELASQVADGVINGSIAEANVLLTFVKQSRPWLSFKVGTMGAQTPPRAEDPTSLLYTAGSEDIYGPIEEQGTKVCWYICTHNIVVLGMSLRWHVIAEVADGYLALSWIGFGTDTEKRRHEQFAFWRFIPDDYARIERLIGGTWKQPPLPKLLLVKMWDEYQNNPEYKWTNERVRAEKEGIVFSAHAGTIDLEGSGLEKLAKKVATECTHVLGLNPQSAEADKLFRTVLKTFIKEWGTKAFQLRLHARKADGNEERLFRGYVYFGTGKTRLARPGEPARLPTQDTLQHISCYPPYGNSRAALEYLIKQLTKFKI